ncbi:MAG TPA: YciI family protein [Candidatus Angelobacter sp.]|jgi:hypothetical protein|nr:YciI family protein [Candidatus Angelobacter sp.]
MKYAFLLWQDESKMPAPGTPAFDAQNQAYGAFYEEAAAGGHFQVGDPFQPSTAGTTVRVRGGATAAESGPHAGGPEQLIGYYVLDVADQAQAVALAAKIPAAAAGAVEVRPIMVM